LGIVSLVLSTFVLSLEKEFSFLGSLLQQNGYVFVQKETADDNMLRLATQRVIIEQN